MANTETTKIELPDIIRMLLQEINDSGKVVAGVILDSNSKERPIVIFANIEDDMPTFMHAAADLIAGIPEERTIREKLHKT